jgi:hypothetical protein
MFLICNGSQDLIRKADGDDDVMVRVNKDELEETQTSIGHIADCKITTGPGFLIGAEIVLLATASRSVLEFSQQMYVYL